MKHLILFAVLLLILGCQAPKDRSGDAVMPKANPNANDPKVKTQVEPRVIVLDEEKLVVNPNRENKLNEMSKENLAEQSIQKTFKYTNNTEDTLRLRINGFSAVAQNDCVSNAKPVLTAVTISQGDPSRTDVLDPDHAVDIATVKAAQSLQLTITMTNPGQCKSLKYTFTVTPFKARSAN